MSPTLEIDVKSVEDLAHFLIGMEDAAEDLSVPLSDLADDMLLDVTGAFPSGGASLGLSWARHAESTVIRWGTHEFGQGPTGNLLGSIHKFVRKFVAGVESTAPHAHLFEYGHAAEETAMSAGGKVHIRRARGVPASGGKVQPEREFLLITDNRTQEGIDKILDYVLGVGTYTRAA